MLENIKPLQYQELPANIKADVSKSDFLEGFTDDLNSSVVLLVIDAVSEIQKEIEYSLDDSRELSLDERHDGLRAPRVLQTPEPGLKVTQYFDIQPETGQVYENYEVFSLETEKRIANTSQMYYSLYKNTVDIIVKYALEEARFPEIYASWSANDKVDYWVSFLYRSRRQNVEGGAEENVIFCPELVQEMKKTDKNVLVILPQCIKKLAFIEGIDDKKLMTAFVEKTGLDLKCTSGK